MTGPTTPHDPFSGPGRAGGPGGDPLDAVRQVFADEPVVPLVIRMRIPGWLKQFRGRTSGTATAKVGLANNNRGRLHFTYSIPMEIAS